jgi:hypothetical protein
MLLGALFCAAAAGLRLLAWYDGTQGRYGLLMLANVLRLPVVYLTYAFALWSVDLLPQERSAGLKQLHLFVCLALVVLACAGFPLLWPGVLVAVTILISIEVGRIAARRALGLRPVLLRAFLGVAMFTLTWYLSTGTTFTALRGLGERIDATVGADRLRAWAKEQIDKTPADKFKHLSLDEVPEDIFDLMGSIPGWPFVLVVRDNQPHVFLANGSGYGYSITIYPYDESESNASVAGLTWRPGIVLSIASK